MNNTVEMGTLEEKKPIVPDEKLDEPPPTDDGGKAVQDDKEDTAVEVEEEEKTKKTEDKEKQPFYKLWFTWFWRDATWHEVLLVAGTMALFLFCFLTLVGVELLGLSEEDSENIALAICLICTFVFAYCFLNNRALLSIKLDKTAEKLTTATEKIEKLEVKISDNVKEFEKNLDTQKKSTTSL